MGLSVYRFSGAGRIFEPVTPAQCIYIYALYHFDVFHLVSISIIFPNSSASIFDLFTSSCLAMRSCCHMIIIWIFLVKLDAGPTFQKHCNSQWTPNPPSLFFRFCWAMSGHLKMLPACHKTNRSPEIAMVKGMPVIGPRLGHPPTIC